MRVVSLAVVLGMACAEPYPGGRSVETVGRLLDVAEAYITIDSVGLQTTFDEGAARADGMAESDIAWINKLVAAQRSLMGSDRLLDAQPDLPEGLEGFFADYASSGAGMAHAKDHCGGSEENPWGCNGWVDHETDYTTPEGVAQYLEDTLGYHETSGYASGYSDWDYTYPRWLECHDAPIVRNQAIIYYEEPTQTYWFSVQHDLNPEVYDSYLIFDWPHWWWDTYVQWWHRDYC